MKKNIVFLLIVSLLMGSPVVAMKRKRQDKDDRNPKRRKVVQPEIPQQAKQKEINPTQQVPAPTQDDQDDAMQIDDEQEEAGEEKENQHPGELVDFNRLSDDIVIGEIFEFLSVPDLSSMRLVDKLSNRRVISHFTISTDRFYRLVIPNTQPIDQELIERLQNFQIPFVIEITDKEEIIRAPKIKFLFKKLPKLKALCIHKSNYLKNYVQRELNHEEMGCVYAGNRYFISYQETLAYIKSLVESGRLYFNARPNYLTERIEREQEIARQNRPPAARLIPQVQQPRQQGEIPQTNLYDNRRRPRRPMIPTPVAPLRPVRFEQPGKRRIRRRGLGLPRGEDRRQRTRGPSIFDIPEAIHVEHILSYFSPEELQQFRATCHETNNTVKLHLAQRPRIILDSLLYWIAQQITLLPHKRFAKQLGQRYLGLPPYDRQSISNFVKRFKNQKRFFIYCHKHLLNSLENRETAGRGHLYNGINCLYQFICTDNTVSPVLVMERIIQRKQTGEWSSIRAHIHVRDRQTNLITNTTTALIPAPLVRFNRSINAVVTILPSITQKPDEYICAFLGLLNALYFVQSNEMDEERTDLSLFEKQLQVWQDYLHREGRNTRNLTSADIIGLVQSLPGLASLTNDDNTELRDNVSIIDNLQELETAMRHAREMVFEIPSNQQDVLQEDIERLENGQIPHYLQRIQNTNEWRYTPHVLNNIHRYREHDETQVIMVNIGRHGLTIKLFRRDGQDHITITDSQQIDPNLLLHVAERVYHVFKNNPLPPRENDDTDENQE